MALIDDKLVDEYAKKHPYCRDPQCPWDDLIETCRRLWGVVRAIEHHGHPLEVRQKVQKATAELYGKGEDSNAEID